MLLFPNALCCSLYERNCVCAVTKIFTKFIPANNFCQLLRVTCKRSCTSAGNAQAQLHFRDDQPRAFGISNISNWLTFFQVRKITTPQSRKLFVHTTQMLSGTGMMRIQMLSQCYIISTFGGKYYMGIKDRNDGNTDVVAMFITFWRETSHDY